MKLATQLLPYARLVAAARVLCGWISEMYLDFDANCPDDGEYDYKPVDQNNDYPMTNSVLPVQVQAAVASA